MEDHFTVGNVQVDFGAGEVKLSLINSDLYSLLFDLQRPHNSDNDKIFYQYCKELFKSGCQHLALYTWATSRSAFGLADLALRIDLSLQTKVIDYNIKVFINI